MARMKGWGLRWRRVGKERGSRRKKLRERERKKERERERER